MIPISRASLNPLFKTYYGALENQCKCSPPSLPLTKTTYSTTGSSTTGSSTTGSSSTGSSSTGSSTTVSTIGSSYNSLNTSTNQTQISCRMRYSQQVQTYGTTQSSTSYAKKTCRIGGPTFSY